MNILIIDLDRLPTNYLVAHISLQGVLYRTYPHCSYHPIELKVHGVVCTEIIKSQPSIHIVQYNNCHPTELSLPTVL